DDVICCAWRILQQPACMLPEGCPPETTSARPDDALRVSVGIPTETPDDVRLQIHIAAADHIGAARFSMRFPSDRYRVLGRDAPAEDWLPLAGAEGDEIVMGLIHLGSNTLKLTTSGIDLTLRLQRLEGKPGGGELGALQADISGPDGIKLI